MKFNLLASIVIALFITSCENEDKSVEKKQKKIVQKFENKGHELVYSMVQKVGNYSKLLEKKNVVYTYSYQTPDGKTDISTEKYIFSGELSYGAYKKHERTFPNLEGLIEQAYDGNEFWLKNNDTIINDTNFLKQVAFKRPTNFYWFAMFPKLLDPGLHYEYIEEKTIKNIMYDVVKITFKSMDNRPKDIYQLYINKETSLVDQFLFTVADFGIMDPFLMKIKHKNIEGLLIPLDRKYQKSNWNAEETSEEWTAVNWSDITFNNDLTKADFKK